MNVPCGAGPVVTVLGNMATKTCHFLEWMDSISILVDIEKWMMALHYLTAFYCQATNQTYREG